MLLRRRLADRTRARYREAFPREVAIQHQGHQGQEADGAYEQEDGELMQTTLRADVGAMEPRRRQHALALHGGAKNPLPSRCRPKDQSRRGRRVHCHVRWCPASFVCVFLLSVVSWRCACSWLSLHLPARSGGRHLTRHAHRLAAGGGGQAEATPTTTDRKALRRSHVRLCCHRLRLWSRRATSIRPSGCSRRRVGHRISVSASSVLLSTSTALRRHE